MTVQATGSQTRMVFDWETAYGVTNTAGATRIGKIIPIISESIKFDRNMTSSAVIRGNRNPVLPFLGNKNVAGDITVPVMSESFGWLLRAMFGAPTDGGTTGAYTHAYKLDGVESLPSFMIEKAFLDLETPQYHWYKGCKINSMKISIGGDSELVATFSILGSTMTIGTTAYEVTNDTYADTKFYHSEAAVTGGSSANIKLFELTVNNDLDGDTFCIGGGAARLSITEGQAAVEGSIQALFNTAGVTLLGTADGATEGSLSVAFDSATTTHALTIAIDELVYKPGGPIITGPKGILLDLPFIGYYGNDGDASAVQVTLQNATQNYTT